MNRKKSSIGIIFVMLSCILFSLSGCKWNNESTAKKVEAKLEEKYKESFSTYAIGDRIDTNHTKLHCYPSDDRSILFEVVYTDNGEIKDDYIERKCECELERELISDLKAINIQAVNKIAIYTSNRDKVKEHSYISADKYLEDVQAKDLELYIHLGVNSDDIKTEDDSEKLIRTLKEFSEKHNSIYLLVPVYFYEDVQYNDVKNDFYNNTWIDDAQMEEYIKNSDASERTTVIKINKEKDKIEIHPISILEAATVQ